MKRDANTFQISKIIDKYVYSKPPAFSRNIIFA